MGRDSKRSVLIVGGGTAGWMTAASLAKAFGADHPDAADITLLESPEIGIIGVGEGSFPTLRGTLKRLGIDEAGFLRDAHATFKQGIRFDNWLYTPQTHGRSEYFHPFEPPYGGTENLDLLPYWLLSDPSTRQPFAETVTFQKPIADAFKAPKARHQSPFVGTLNYAYHFDATRLAALLSAHGRGLGVKHRLGRVTDVTMAADGSIASVVTDAHGALAADLYIDCTGFRAELIGKALRQPLRSVQDALFTDRAVALQVPYDTEGAPIASYTISTAHEAGWTWDIGLSERRGIGYVYSSSHSDETRAEDILRSYIGAAAEKLNARHIRFEAGYRERQWLKNCVAIGLSAGFLEPLESTGLMLIEVAIQKLLDVFPYSGRIDASADAFNTQMTARYTTIVDFLKLHYCLSGRSEPFWRDNASPTTVSPRLTHLLDVWRHRPPARSDFILDQEAFAAFSYQYILYGMGFETNYEAARAFSPRTREAGDLIDTLAGFGRQAAKELPSHRDLIRAVYEGGFTERSRGGPLSVPISR